jgi:hypothetical protein
MYRNRKKPVSFTKTHTQKNKYEDLTDSELNTKTREFENTNKNYLNHEPKYVKFLMDYEPRYKKYITLQDLVREFYKKNIVREKVKATTLIFIKYEQDDIYFNSNKLREDFFSLYKNAAKLFIENRDFFYKANSELVGFNYLFPKNDEKNYIKFTQCTWNYFCHDLMQDMSNYTHNGHNIRGYKMAENFYWTERTGVLFTQMAQIYKSVGGSQTNYEIPNIPEASYLRWYFKKLIDANEQEMRKIELVLRSRKRQIELADNLYYVYVMSNKAYPNIYKIGWTSSLPEERAEELTGTGHLHPFKVEYSKKFKNAEQVEQQCHDYFKKDRVANNREFFEVPLEQIKDYIDSI